MDSLFDMRPERPGYRLHRLEAFNWGAFDSTDGQVYCFEPEGRTALLVGHNGSGKSTLVDAILTLLVEPRTRNYNVAAGAKKRERSEQTYIRGAYGRTSDDAQASITNYLRPGGGTLTALAAVFRDEGLDRTFTVCQVMHLTADGSADKVFAIADEARDLKTDLAGLRSSDAVRAHLKVLGYQTTKTFVEYHGWLAKRTKMRGKAMDMFNQTVAVKDIQSLDDFIRQHMLEAHDWREKVSRLLKHFNDLNLAHQELVRARRAEELLTPVEKRGRRYQKHATLLDEAQRKQAAADTFFRCETLRLYEPEITRHESELAATLNKRTRLGGEIDECEEQIRRMKNEIEQAGGQRLRDLPVLIREQQSLLGTKLAARIKFEAELRLCGITQKVADASIFADTKQKLTGIMEKTEQQITAADEKHEELLGQRGDLRRRLREDENELDILSRRTTNLPARLVTLRDAMCRDLDLTESQLPFAAELMAVDPDERRWEASAEMVLRSFALSLLAPERYYRRVRDYVERNRLADARGEGQRLVYLRVGQRSPDDMNGDRLHAQSLLRKLKFRAGHDLAPWVRGEAQRRFDFVCCESIDEFNEAPQLALTENRHVKQGVSRHEKDDRPRTVDPRNFVLGWDNREKKRRLVHAIERLQGELSTVEQDLSAHTGAIDQLRTIRDAARGALAVDDFDHVDDARHAREVATLENEKTELENNNRAVRMLRDRLAALVTNKSQLSSDRDETLKREQALGDLLSQARQLVSNARRAIDRVRDEGRLVGHEDEFDAIRDSLGEPVLSTSDLFEREKKWTDGLHQRVEALLKNEKPLVESLMNAMSRYLGEFREAQTDLDASVDALNSFLAVLDQIRREALPQYEARFKDRLNDKVSQEVGLFNMALNEESKQIADKIAQLNEALAPLEYRPGTHMRLEPREVHDREIADFRRALRECLDESLENTDEANEARFLRIQKLVERLGDKDNTRWRDKVIDVRRWFHFAAREIDAETGETRHFYEDSSGQSGGEKAKLAFTILVAAIAYQYDLDPLGDTPGRFHFVVVDEMFSKVDDQNAEYALKLFKQFGLQLLIVAPLDAKARVTEPFVDSYLQVVKDEQTNRSQLFSMTARQYEEVVSSVSANGQPPRAARTAK